MTEIASDIMQNATANKKGFSCIGFESDRQFTIGRSESCDVTYADKHTSGHHAILNFASGKWAIKDDNSRNGVFVNSQKLPKGALSDLVFGDEIRIMDLKIIVFDHFFMINNPKNLVCVKDFAGRVNYSHERLKKASQASAQAARESKEKPFEHDEFYPSPRFVEKIQEKTFNVEDPPAKEKRDETPLIQKIAPSLLMGVASLASCVVMIYMMTEQQSSGTTSSWLRAIPMAVMAVSMLCGAVVWPVINNRSEAKKIEANEKKRREAYSQYIDRISLSLDRERDAQKSIYERNRKSATSCAKSLCADSTVVMNRRLTDSDALEFRIGLGTEKFKSDVKWPQERFSIEKDELIAFVRESQKEDRSLKNVPLSLNFRDSHTTGVVGEATLTFEFAKQILMQAVSLYSTTEVAVCILTALKDEPVFAEFKRCPHMWLGSNRLFAASDEEVAEVSVVLARILEERCEAKNDQISPPHILIVATDEARCSSNDVLDAIMENKNCGMSVVCLSKAEHMLPKQTNAIINLMRENTDAESGNKATGTLKTRESQNAQSTFTMDEPLTHQLLSDALTSLNIILGKNEENSVQAQAKLGFLDLFESGSVEGLNLATRWASADATKTLGCAVGVDTTGEKSYIDLHEKVQGPHALIAGTTGSGKSEWIITWILSMCVTYSPEDVNFLLIDYKGGGLSAAFDNDNCKLPHLSGTITNLDGAMIARSLVSIKSELKRRQAVLNDAREANGGDNCDVYDYVKLYKSGLVDTPLPHLFIVADEFAELKAQEPEFMDELISAARIGRSLGVHLILATQKPSGVVNDQIWSNSRLKICLKVADAGDSKEMIKRPDAAELKEAGEFYTLLGYSEGFDYGRAAYTGAPYTEIERWQPPIDESVLVCSNTGSVLARLEEKQRIDEHAKSVLVATLLEIERVAKTLDLTAQQLWLDPIPEHITLNNLREWHASDYELATANPYVLNPPIGEVDDPENQAKHLLTLPLTEKGNAVIYGSGGSGVEGALLTIMASFFEKPVSEVNAYIMDFGSEQLSSFRKDPHVGGYCTARDEEKCNRLVNFVDKEFKKRTEILGEFGGSFVDFAKQTQGFPNIVVVINGVATFSDLFGNDAVTQLVSLTRDCARCGIYFILVAGTVSEVYTRLRTNFPYKLALQLNNETDYTEVVGSTRGVSLPTKQMQGLIKVRDDKSGQDKTYNVVFAHLAEEGKSDFESAKTLAQARQTDARAKQIPTLPEHVSVETMTSEVPPTLSAVPIGVDASELEPCVLDFENELVARVVVKDVEESESFLDALIRVSEMIPNAKVHVFGAETHESNFVLNEELQNMQNSDAKTIVFVLGASNFFHSVDDGKECANTLNNPEVKLTKKGNLRFVLVDTMNGLKDVCTYQAFATSIDKSNCLWLCAGFSSNFGFVETGSAMLNRLPKLQANQGYFVHDTLVHVTQLLEEGK